MRDKEINSGNRVRKKNGFDAVYEEYHKMVFRIAYHIPAIEKRQKTFHRWSLVDITFFQKPVV